MTLEEAELVHGLREAKSRPCTAQIREGCPSQVRRAVAQEGRLGEWGKVFLMCIEPGTGVELASGT